MENATQALIMIGTVLLALLILFMGVTLYGRLNQTSDAYVTKLDTIELQKYNKNFEIYEGRKDLTAQDIITAAGVAHEKDLGTKVYLKDDDITNWNNEQKNIFLSGHILLNKADGTVENVFKCKNIVYNDDAMVILIVFEKIS